MAIKTYGSPPPVHEEFLTKIVGVNWSDKKGGIGAFFAFKGTRGISPPGVGGQTCNPGTPTDLPLSAGYETGISYVRVGPSNAFAAVTMSTPSVVFAPWTVFNVDVDPFRTESNGGFNGFHQEGLATSATVPIGGSALGGFGCWGGTGEPGHDFGVLAAPITSGDKVVQVGSLVLIVSAPAVATFEGKRYRYDKTSFLVPTPLNISVSVTYKDIGPA